MAKFVASFEIFESNAEDAKALRAAERIPSGFNNSAQGCNRRVLPWVKGENRANPERVD